MYYETGNYRQARNYFEKAILLTSPAAKRSGKYYKINIASLLVKLEEFDQLNQYMKAFYLLMRLKMRFIIILQLLT